MAPFADKPGDQPSRGDEMDDDDDIIMGDSPGAGSPSCSDHDDEEEIVELEEKAGQKRAGTPVDNGRKRPRRSSPLLIEEHPIDGRILEAHLSVLISMGFPSTAASVALRLSKGDPDRAVLILTRDLPGLDEELRKLNGEVILEEVEEVVDDADVINPNTLSMSALTKIQIAVSSNQTLFFQTNGYLDRVIKSALVLVESDMYARIDDFMDRLLPDVISRHVNPSNISYMKGMNPEQLNACINFCLATIPLLVACIKKLPLKTLSDCLVEMFDRHNKLFKAAKILDFQPPESQYAPHRKANWMKFTTVEKMRTMYKGDLVPMEEMVDSFCNYGGIENLHATMLRADDEMTPMSLEDILAILRIASSTFNYLEGHHHEGMLVNWCEIVEKVVAGLQDKDIRNEKTRMTVLSICDELHRISSLMASYQVAGYDDYVLKDKIRLSFLRSCLKCSQLDARMFALKDLGLLAKNLSEIFPEISVSASVFNKWLEDEDILKTVLAGNLDMPAYVDKIRPILGHLAVTMTHEDILFIWGLRKGRLGQSFTNYASLLSLIAARFNATQMESLFLAFTSTIEHGETLTFDRIFELCFSIGKDIGRGDRDAVPEITVKICDQMWDLIHLVRKQRHGIIVALRYHVNLLQCLRCGVTKERFLREAIALVTAKPPKQEEGNPIAHMPLSFLLYLRELLEVGPKKAVQSSTMQVMTRKAAALRSQNEGWGDFGAEQTRMLEIRCLLGESCLFDKIIDNLIFCHAVVTAKMAASGAEFVIPEECSLDGLDLDGENSSSSSGANVDLVMEAEVCDGMNLVLALDIAYGMLTWLMQHQIVNVTFPSIDRLWDTVAHQTKSISYEKEVFFAWLSLIPEKTPVPPDTIESILKKLCKCDLELMTLQGAHCLYVYMDRFPVKSMIVNGKVVMAHCRQYEWQLLESSDDLDVVKLVTRKLVERGKGLDGESGHHSFLNTCYNQLSRLQTAYFLKNGQLASPTPSTNQSTSSTVTPSVSKEDADDKPSTSQQAPQPPGSPTIVQLEVDTAPQPGPPHSQVPPTIQLPSARHLDDRILLRGIDRILQVVSCYSEAGDESFYAIRQFPSHGSRIPGVPLRVEFSVENDALSEGRGKQELMSNSREPVAQFRARLYNRLHFRNVGGTFTMHVKVPSENGRADLEREVSILHPWKTVEQAGLCPPFLHLSTGRSEFVRVKLIIRANRYSSGSSLRAVVNPTPASPTPRCEVETQLPMFIISKSRDLYPLLSRLRDLPDKRVRDSVRHLLSLIPSDSLIEKSFAIEVDEEATQQAQLEADQEDLENEETQSNGSSASSDSLSEPAVYRFKNKAEVLARLDPAKPLEMIYALEVLCSLLVPVRLTTSNVDRARHLAQCIYRDDVIAPLCLLLTQPSLFESARPTDRATAFELILVILKCVLCCKSPNHSAIHEDSRALRLLEKRHSTVASRRIDLIYEDISHMKMCNTNCVSNWSREMFVQKTECVRNFVWQLAGGCLGFTRAPCRIRRREKDSGSGSGSGGTSVDESESPCSASSSSSNSSVMDIDAASAAIRAGKALQAREESLVCSYLHLLFSFVDCWTPQDRNDYPLPALCEDSWRSFWADLILNTKEATLRRMSSERFAQLFRRLSCRLATDALECLLAIMGTMPADDKPSAELDNLGRRQREQSSDVRKAVDLVMDLLKIEYPDKWNEMKVFEETKLLWIASAIVSFPIDDKFYEVDCIYLANRVTFLENVLKSVIFSSDFYHSLANILLESLLRDRLFPKYNADLESHGCNATSSTRWSQSELRQSTAKLLGKLARLHWPTSEQLLTILHDRYGKEVIPESNQWSEVDERDLDHVGLKNDGGTCYMNSVLQQMLAMPGLASRWVMLEIDPYLKWGNVTSKLVVEMQRALANLMFLRQKIYVPKGLWESFQFTGEDQLDTKQQHDAMDFLMEIIDRCDTVMQKLELPMLFKSRMSGKFAYEYICYECKNRHQGPLEEFLTVNLELHGDSLEQCFQHYVDGELLEGDNAFSCSKCNEKRTALRRGSFHELPSTLSIQLKRFSFDFTGRQAQKNNEECKFPLYLDMSSYMKDAREVDNQNIQILMDEMCSSSQQSTAKVQSEEALLNDPSSPLKRTTRRRRVTSTMQTTLNSDDYRYELVGVLCHTGVAAAGHYYSYIKEHRDEMTNSSTYGEWLELNDTNVRQFDVDDCNEQWYGGHFKVIPEAVSLLALPENRTRSWNAYVLFYEKVERRLTEAINFAEQAAELPPTRPRSFTHDQIFSQMPTWLGSEIIAENSSFYKERDLYSTEYRQLMLDGVMGYVDMRKKLREAEEADDNMEEEEDEDEEMDDEDEGIDAVFKHFFPFCVNVLWRLKDLKDDSVKKSFDVLSYLVSNSQLGRQIFFNELVKDDSYLFKSLVNPSSPDLPHSWWRLLNRAIDAWAENPTPGLMDSETELLRQCVLLMEYGRYRTVVFEYVIRVLNAAAGKPTGLKVLEQLSALKNLQNFIIDKSNGDGPEFYRVLVAPLDVLKGPLLGLPRLFLSLISAETELLLDPVRLPADPIFGVLQLNCQTLLVIIWMYCHTQPHDEEIRLQWVEMLSRGYRLAAHSDKQMKLFMDLILKWMTNDHPLLPHDTWYCVVKCVVKGCETFETVEIERLRRHPTEQPSRHCVRAMELFFDARETEAAEDNTLHCGIIPWLEHQLTESNANVAGCAYFIEAFDACFHEVQSPMTHNALSSRIDRVRGIRHRAEEFRMQQMEMDVVSDHSAGRFLHDQSGPELISIHDIAPIEKGINSNFRDLFSRDVSPNICSATALVTSSDDILNLSTHTHREEEDEVEEEEEEDEEE